VCVCVCVCIYILSNSNTLKRLRGATLVHRKNTREPLIYIKRRTKVQKLKEIINGQAIECYYLCVKAL